MKCPCRRFSRSSISSRSPVRCAKTTTGAAVRPRPRYVLRSAEPLIAPPGPVPLARPLPDRVQPGLPAGARERHTGGRLGDGRPRAEAVALGVRNTEPGRRQDTDGGLAGAGAGAGDAHDAHGLRTVPTSLCHGAILSGNGRGGRPGAAPRGHGVPPARGPLNPPVGADASAATEASRSWRDHMNERTRTGTPSATVTGLVDHVLAPAAARTRWNGEPVHAGGRLHTPHKAIRRVTGRLAEMEARLAGVQPQPDHGHASTITTEADPAPSPRRTSTRPAAAPPGSPASGPRASTRSPANSSTTRPARAGASANPPAKSTSPSTTPTPWGPLVTVFAGLHRAGDAGHRRVGGRGGIHGSSRGPGEPPCRGHAALTHRSFNVHAVP